MRYRAELEGIIQAVWKWGDHSSCSKWHTRYANEYHRNINKTSWVYNYRITNFHSV